MDTLACGIVALILAVQWKWYINIRRDVKLVKKNLITGIIDRAHMDEVDIGDFSVLGQNKKPEAPKVGWFRRPCPPPAPERPLSRRE